VALDGLPDPGAPEVAFAGRSNVGKSSLINALTGRTGIARASNTPGRTQEINYFDLSARLRLVDLPGYGYAEAPVALVKRWTKLVDLFLLGRAELTRAYLLIDSRHGLKPNDRDMMKRLDKAAVSYQLVLTKADKISPAALAKVVTETEAAARKHVAAYPLVRATSSETGAGIDLLRADVAALAWGPPAPFGTPAAGPIESP
jgi:GTP-binding protein